MTSLPEPLVPAGCTMAGNDWYPLHFDRLRKSKWWRRASDLARARNVMLWGEAYKQVPAGSMPDDDDDLAEAAGFGMDVEAFILAKPEIMAPWVLCNDGRWYHPTVCEVVMDAWERASEKRKKAAEKKAAQRAKIQGQRTGRRNVPKQTSDVPGDTENVPEDTKEKGGDIGTHDRQDTIVQTEPPNPPNGGPTDEGFEKVWKAYPVQCRSTIAKPLVRQIYETAIESGGTEARILAAALDVDELAKAGGKPLRIDRWLKRGVWANHEPEPSAPGQTWPGPANLWAAAIARDVTGFLRPATVVGSELVTPTAIAARKLDEAIGQEIRSCGLTVVHRKAAA